MAVKVVTGAWLIAWKALQAFGSIITTYSTGDLNQKEKKLRSVHGGSEAF